MALRSVLKNDTRPMLNELIVEYVNHESECNQAISNVVMLLKQ